MAVLYNSTEDLDTFLRSGCDLNYAGAHRSEIRTDCVSPVFRQLGIPCREEVRWGRLLTDNVTLDACSRLSTRATPR